MKKAAILFQFAICFALQGKMTAHLRESLRWINTMCASANSSETKLMANFGRKLEGQFISTPFYIPNSILQLILKRFGKDLAKQILMAVFA